MPTMTITTIASPAMRSPDVPPLVSAAGLVDGEGTVLVGAALVGAALVGDADVGDADVGAGVGLVPA